MPKGPAASSAVRYRYIELFRNTPYLLWIFICVVFCPCPGFFARKMFGLTSVEMKLLFKAALASSSSTPPSSPRSSAAA